eukprot:1667372-Amphidinium_carterae.1
MALSACEWSLPLNDDVAVDLCVDLHHHVLLRNLCIGSDSGGALTPFQTCFAQLFCVTLGTK